VTPRALEANVELATDARATLLEARDEQVRMTWREQHRERRPGRADRTAIAPPPRVDESARRTCFARRHEREASLREPSLDRRDERFGLGSFESPSVVDDYLERVRS